ELCDDPDPILSRLWRLQQHYLTQFAFECAHPCADNLGSFLRSRPCRTPSRRRRFNIFFGTPMFVIVRLVYPLPRKILVAELVVGILSDQTALGHPLLGSFFGIASA